MSAEPSTGGGDLFDRLTAAHGGDADPGSTQALAPFDPVWDAARPQATGPEPLVWPTLDHARAEIHTRETVRVGEADSERAVPVATDEQPSLPSDPDIIRVVSETPPPRRGPRATPSAERHDEPPAIAAVDPVDTPAPVAATVAPQIVSSTPARMPAPATIEVIEPVRADAVPPAPDAAPDARPAEAHAPLRVPTSRTAPRRQVSIEIGPITVRAPAAPSPAPAPAPAPRRAGRELTDYLGWTR